MLEKSDLMAIENIFNKFAEKMDQKLDGKFKEQDQKIDRKFAEQDQKIDEKFAEQDQKIDEKFAEQDQKLDGKFKEQDKSIDKKFAKMKRESKKMDFFLLDEIERNRNILETRMDKMQQDINEVKSDLKQLYRITGQENERSDIEFAELHRKDSELDNRVTKLENCAMA